MVCDFVPERRLAALAARSGLSAAEVHARVWESGLDALMDEGAYDLAAARRAVAGALGMPLAADELSALWALAFEPRPDVLDAVDAIRRLARTGLLTDNGPLLQAALPAHLPDVASRFEWWLFSCDLGAVKPALRLFLAAAARIGLPPGALLLVDDRPANVEGARRAGLSALLFRDAPTLRRELAG